MKKKLAVIFGWLITIVIPFSLLLSSIRVLLTPTYIDVEYSMPGFPEDPYGMTFPERRENAKIALRSILQEGGISLLAEQRFADGSPMYNERELGHMQDVKDLTGIVLDVWLLLLALLIGTGVASWHFGSFQKFSQWMVRGGQLTIGLIVTALVFVALSFNALFTGFHRIFFQGDTWLFLYSDTLIRLFPLRFWQDVFIALGVLTLLGAGLIWLVFGRIRLKGRNSGL
jgi:integral membrane protein (TIGR01906 family)